MHASKQSLFVFTCVLSCVLSCVLNCDLWLLHHGLLFLYHQFFLRYFPVFLIFLFLVLQLLLHHLGGLPLLQLSLLIPVGLEHHRLSVQSREMLPQHIKRPVYILRRDGRPNPTIFNLNGDKLGLVLAVGIVVEPVVEVVGIDPPAVIDLGGVLDPESLHLREHDCLGCHEGDVVFLDQDVALSYGHVLVLVQHLQILGHLNIIGVSLAHSIILYLQPALSPRQTAACMSAGVVLAGGDTMNFDIQFISIKVPMKPQRRPQLELPNPNNKNTPNLEDYTTGSYAPGHIAKTSSGSLNKYNKSPYLQKIAHGFSLPKRPGNNPAGDSKPSTNGRDRNSQADGVDEAKENQQQGHKARRNESATDSIEQHRSSSNMSGSSEQRDKGAKFKLPKIEIDYFKTDKKQKINGNTLSATLDATTKKKKLMPISQNFRNQYAVKTKAGTNGTQTKVNQDIAIVDQNLPFGIKLYCVCDGHGLNGHIVSGFIKQYLLKSLNTALKKLAVEPPNIQQIFERCLAETNDNLLNSDINTQLSGSTVIAVFLHKETLYAFNVGDSRAILVSQAGHDEWKVTALSHDQKPCREDEKQRILKFGGRVEAQRNERGQVLGPLRVWMKDVQMPGLAMTRSFGDKAGIKAGTNGEPELLQHSITDMDKFLVIASDGVWEYLQNEQVMNICTPFYKKGDLELAAEKVMRISAQIWHKISYSRDDITVIIVGLNPPNSSSDVTLVKNITSKLQ